jgi:transcriptional regulator of acetoin/glycerol metabolism
MTDGTESCPGPRLSRRGLILGLAAAAVAGGERLRILAALTATRWNKTDAARRLQCSRMTLYRRMRRHGLPGEDGA